MLHPPLTRIPGSVSDHAHTDPSSFRDTMQFALMPDSFDLDRGLVLAVQAIQLKWELVNWVKQIETLKVVQVSL
ncbi:hypothetical protein Tco_0618602 [Tanacetum coccineum]